MTFHLNDYMHLAFNFRNGIGFDIEACSSRPIWINRPDESCGFACFNGLALLLPFTIITLGEVSELEEFE